MQEIGEDLGLADHFFYLRLQHEQTFKHRYNLLDTEFKKE